ncbi:MAG TPA: cation transporter, partial [Anaerolineae bacterium]|nr:cation transporter [Anaerolineae bacterium]
LAFAFNGVGVPLAATGLLHPVWAMVAMVTSVSTVLLNSFAGQLIPRRREVAEVRVETLTLSVPSIHCMGCVAALQRRLLQLDGVEEVTGDPAARTLTVIYRRDQTDTVTIQEEIVALGHVVV